MSKSRNSRAAAPKPASAVHPEMLAQYRRAARAPTIRVDVRTMATLTSDYCDLVAAGDLAHALGAGLELVDVGLRIAATPDTTDVGRQLKAGFFDLHFPSLVGSFGHSHVVRIANAAVAAEKASRRT